MKRAGGSYIIEPGSDEPKLVERTEHSPDGDRPRDDKGERIRLDEPEPEIQPAQAGAGKRRRTPPGESSPPDNQAPASDAAPQE